MLQLEAAAKPVEQILALVAEQLGAAAVKTAASLLPPALRLPLEVALRAVERVLDLGRDLGLGR
jgi:hypothetical protein